MFDGYGNSFGLLLFFLVNSCIMDAHKYFCSGARKLFSSASCRCWKIIFQRLVEVYLRGYNLKNLHHFCNSTNEVVYIEIMYLGIVLINANMLNMLNRFNQERLWSSRLEEALRQVTSSDSVGFSKKVNKMTLLPTMYHDLKG